MDLKEVLKQMDHETDAITDFIIKDIQLDPHDPFASKAKVREKIKQQIVSEELHDRFPKGLKLIMENLKTHVSKVELNELTDELDGALTKMASMAEEKESTVGGLSDKLGEMPDTLQEIFGISDKTIDLFYQSGCRYYEMSHYMDAADVFHAISLLAPTKFNVWFSLGMAEKQAAHYEKALQAFAMATLTNLASPIPHIQSAECYLLLKDDRNAKETFEYALKVIKENPDNDSKKHEEFIRSEINKNFK